MIFNTWLFGLFALLFMPPYWFVPKRWRVAYLSAIGIIFYAASVPGYTVLIITLAVFTYVVGIRIIKAERDIGMRRLWLTVGVSLSIGCLAFFKYTKFLAANLCDLFHGACFTLPDIVIPLAISFFTFEFVHVLVDVYLGKIRQLTVRDFAPFALFFPTMVAGPIKRYQNFVPQIHRDGKLTGIVFASAIFRITLGLAKKVIIADSMTTFTQPLLHPSSVFGPVDYWAATLAYTAKIYFDFSGYSDIAIGLAALLGFQILENFDRPYWSENISQFWRRWHMSLSSWIRDYIFIPLGGSRKKGWVAFNLTLVMALAGLWHGAAWHFVAWGLWNGAGLAAHRAWGSVLSRSGIRVAPGPPSRAVSIALTFGFVMCGWVLFAAPSVGTALVVYRHALGF
jgi:alginate O-acetyltransferase complex protein AlgI